MKRLFFVIMAVLTNCIVGGLMASTLGVAPMLGAIGLNSISAIMSGTLPSGVAMIGVYTEVWTGEVVKQFSNAENATFLEGVPDYSRYAQNDVIHLVDAGVDPTVLINNTTYPIPMESLNDTDSVISLDKYQTKVTPITDDELYAISYDKMALVKTKHGNAIACKKQDKAIHAFGPASNTVDTPVIKTTGDLVDGRRRLTRADLVSLKKSLDNAKVPLEGRRLVLCPDHVEDLLLFDQKFADQYYNYTSGKISNLLGFEIYEYIENPVYTTAGVKKSFGAIPTAGEYQASVFFHLSSMFKCAGSTNMYFSKAETDPEYQRNKIAFTHRFICLPKTSRGTGAIYSANA